jgi:hypothetical protein
MYHPTFYFIILFTRRKAENTPSPSLPRVRGRRLQLHPRSPWIWGILDFRSIKVKLSLFPLSMVVMPSFRCAQKHKRLSALSVCGDFPKAVICSISIPIKKSWKIYPLYYSRIFFPGTHDLASEKWAGGISIKRRNRNKNVSRAGAACHHVFPRSRQRRADGSFLWPLQ